PDTHPGARLRHLASTLPLALCRSAAGTARPAGPGPTRPGTPRRLPGYVRRARGQLPVVATGAQADHHPPGIARGRPGHRPRGRTVRRPGHATEGVPSVVELGWRSHT